MTRKLCLHPVDGQYPYWVLDGSWPPPAGLWSIGRDPQCDIHIIDSRLSKRHAELRATDVTQAGDRVWLWELKDGFSTNGTYINSRALKPGLWVDLMEKDILWLGGLVYRVSHDDDDTSGTKLMTEPVKQEQHHTEVTGDAPRGARPWWAEWVESIWAWWTKQPLFVQWIMLVTSGGLAALLLWVWKL